MSKNNKLSEKIPWEEAVKKINHYNLNHEIHNPPGSSNHLLHFEFRKATMNQILSQNGGPHPEIYLALGYYKEGNTFGIDEGYTMIALSIDQHNNPILSSGAKIYDSSSGQFIDSIRALGLIGEYKLTKNANIPIHAGSSELLKGFRFDSDELLAVLKIPNLVHFKWAYHEKDSTAQEPPYSKGYTLVMIGIDDMGSPITTDGKVFDYCHPCPSSCPIGI